MKIICDTTFLDGVDRFEAGDARTVDDQRGAYFVANGWAHPAGAEPAAEPAAAAAADSVTLAVNNGTLGQAVRHG
jgi:hypothetical protein